MITPSNRTCPQCGKAGYIYYIDSISTYEAKCFNCNYYFVHGELNKYNKRQLITNADHIKAMSDEELAEVISNLGDCDTCYLYHRGCSMNISCKDAVLEWLKKESE